jgi:hypothetical protein
MSESSTVELLYEQTVNAGDWIDLASYCVVSEATFDSASNANPGTMEASLRDPVRDLPTIVTGHRLKLKVDGQQLWSGFTLIRGRGSFFPAGDGKESTRARRWTLRGTDNNVLIDRRVLRNPSNYLLHIPFITTDTMDGALIRYALANYTDMPTADPWLDISSEIDDVMIPSSDGTGHITSAHPWEYPQQGSYLRGLFQDANLSSLAVFFIGPDDKFHYHAFQTRECPWGFSDRPNHAPITSTSGPFEGAYWGFRELEAEEDGSAYGTDALVWGGSQWAGSGQTVFHRATDATLEGVHGKWQIPETHFDETNYKLAAGVTQRANLIVFGNPTGDSSGSEPGTVVGEGPRGMRFPGWTYSFVWHTGNVPVLAGVPRHLYPGDIVPIQLWTYSEDGGVTPFTKYLPLRALRLSFYAAEGGKAVVKFQGTFDLRNEDSMFLWKWLRSREPQINSIAIPVSGDGSTTYQYGSLGSFALLPPGATDPTTDPDGTSVVYHAPVGYIPGTTIVTKNGLTETFGDAYTESSSDAGEVTFWAAPKTTDTLWIQFRTLAG